MRMRIGLALTLMALAASAFGQTAQSSPQLPQVSTNDTSEALVATVPQKDTHSFLGSPRYSVSKDRSLTQGVSGADCLFIRSYIFDRQDGTAPELQKVTTCTPSSRFQRRNAVLNHKIKVMPVIVPDPLEEPR